MLLDSFVRIIPLLLKSVIICVLSPVQLKEYQKLDRDKRSLEYTIYDRELKKIAEDLEEVRVFVMRDRVNTRT